jgi:hypothetical protein
MRSTRNRDSVIPSDVGRKKLYSENTLARFPKGTLERIAAVLREGEDRTDFFREAVDRELRRRERLKARRGQRKAD